jgi:hypothetical protein
MCSLNMNTIGGGSGQMANGEGTIGVCIKVRCYLRGLGRLLGVRLACSSSILDLVGVYWFSEEMQKQ